MKECQLINIWKNWERIISDNITCIIYWKWHNEVLGIDAKIYNNCIHLKAIILPTADKAPFNLEVKYIYVELVNLNLKPDEGLEKRSNPFNVVFTLLRIGVWWKLIMRRLVLNPLCSYRWSQILTEALTIQVKWVQGFNDKGVKFSNQKCIFAN